MTLRSALRAVLWLTNELVPAQAVRCARGRDYNRALVKAAPKSERELVEREAEVDCLEPHNGLGSVKPCACGRMLNFWASRDYGHETWLHADDNTAMCESAAPSMDSLFKAYWDARTPAAETQALDDLDRYYPNWRPSERPTASAASATSDPSSESPRSSLDAVPTPDCDIPPSPGVGTTNVVSDVLRQHLLFAGLDGFDCWCLAATFPTIGGWSDHVAEAINAALHPK